MTDYRYPHSLAVCTLGSQPLKEALEAKLQEAIQSNPSLVGLMIAPLSTENLGIEAIITFCLGQPHLRTIILCGADAQQAVGWLPGGTLLALQQHGVLTDALHTIANAPGKRPVLANLTLEAIAAFRQQVTFIDAIGEENPDTIWKLFETHLAQPLPPVEPYAGRIQQSVPKTIGTHNPAITEDPQGYFVITTDASSETPLVAEYFSTEGLRQAIVWGKTPKSVYAVLINNGWLSRLDHAAYVGQELARAEAALAAKSFYMQDLLP
jgi:tetrahydromethanopterin S-methyltransferase subunit A